MSIPKRVLGTIAIPLISFIILEALCLQHGSHVITNMRSFDNFVVYVAIVMLTTIALSINLNSGRFDFSLGSMAALSAVIGAKITYAVLGGGQGSAAMMLLITVVAGALLGLISGCVYVALRIPPIITSLGITLIYEGIMYTITEGKYLRAEVQNSSMSGFVSTWKYAFVIIVVVLVATIVLAVVFYALIIFGVGYLMNPQDILASQSGSGMVTADAMAKAFNSSIMSKVLIVGGMCGIVTSWNSFLIGGSRAMYSMAESYMIPRFFVKLHKKYKTPVNALYLIGALSVLAPFCGRKMLVWIVDAGNFGCCLAYCMVAISFIILRKKEPDMARPYKVKHYKIVGVIAVLMSGLMVAMYVIPNSGCTLVWQEVCMAGGWCLLGLVFCVACKLKYKEKFGSHIDVAIDDSELEEKTDDLSVRVEKAINTVKVKEAEKYENPSINFSFFLPVNVVFGCGKLKEVGNLTKPYGKKALIVTGKSSAKKSGIYDKVNESLKKVGIDTVLFDKVTPNPLTTTAIEGAKFANENGCDVVIGIGGGSIMDCAKAIAFLSVNKGDINDYIFNKIQSDKALPLVLIPTTCGTGSEGNGFAVLTNPENGDKKSLRCNAIVAKVSIVDPECMMTMPKKVLASVGFDALCHNIEAYTSKISQPFTDALSLYAISLIADNLVDVYNGSEEKEAWEKITLASTIGGMVINTAGVTLAHGMEHPASGLKNIVHGQGLAALTPTIIEASYKGNRDKFGKIARIFGGLTAEDCSMKIRTLLKKLDLECKLSDLGITEEDIPWMAENCMKVSAASVKNNPIVFTKEEIAEIYKKAL